MQDKSQAQCVKSPKLKELEHSSNISHGFFTRLGGCSEGIFSSLNAGLGSGDDTETVIENRRRICNAIGTEPSNLATLYQHHSADVFIATGGIEKDRPKADGIVTNTPGTAIGVVTADCGPVLFADPVNKVIGAAHAGWRGAFDGVLQNTIEQMIQLGAARENITASLGPCISQKNYEVGPEFYQRFIDKDKGLSKYFKPSEKADHYMYDLNSFIQDQLKSAGVIAEDLAICTYEGENEYFSFRRTTHRAEQDYGRQLSLISLG
ncbi:MAG: peptidoglycan editing factor PgeF [Rhizobiaceae bacterium]|nr:peptidoglycan editing factor PgeF [Rhizobiaceae bacterium]